MGKKILFVSSSLRARSNSERLAREAEQKADVLNRAYEFGKGL